MASLGAAKQHLRSVMKQRLGAVPHESIVMQSMAVKRHPVRRALGLKP